MSKKSLNEFILKIFKSKFLCFLKISLLSAINPAISFNFPTKFFLIYLLTFSFLSITFFFLEVFSIVTNNAEGRRLRGGDSDAIFSDTSGNIHHVGFGSLASLPGSDRVRRKLNGSDLHCNDTHDRVS